MRRKKTVDIQNWSRAAIYLLFIIDILLVLSFFSFSFTIISEIYLVMLIYSVSSAILFMTLVEIFKIKMVTFLELVKYEKKPRFFKFGFFLFSFLATFFTIFSARLYNDPLDFLKYLKYNWYFMAFYDIAVANGWYHYILRIDE